MKRQRSKRNSFDQKIAEAKTRFEKSGCGKHWQDVFAAPGAASQSKSDSDPFWTS